MMAAAASLAWLRLPGTARAVFWAEDGAVFVHDAMVENPFAIILQPYSGYLHAAPRILAGIVVSVTPVTLYPQVTTALSMSVVAAIAVAVFYLSAHVEVGLVGRVGLFAVTIVSPASAVEVLGNFANLHWYFLWLAPWVFISRPRSRHGGALWGVVALLILLTEVQAVLFLPLLLWRVRGSNRLWIAAGALLGAAGQVSVTLLFPRGSAFPAVDTAMLLLTAKGYVLHVGGGLWGLSNPAPTVVVVTGWLVATAALFAPYIAIAFWSVLKAPALRAPTIAALVASALLWVAAAFVNDLPRQVARQIAALSRDGRAEILTLRHAVVPALLMAAVALLGADHLIRLATRWARTAGIAMTAVLAGVALLSFTGDPAAQRRHTEVGWSAQLAAATLACTDLPAEASIDVAIAPKTWTMSVPCERLRQP